MGETRCDGQRTKTVPTVTWGEYQSTVKEGSHDGASKRPVGVGQNGEPVLQREADWLYARSCENSVGNLSGDLSSFLGRSVPSGGKRTTNTGFLGTTTSTW